MKTIASAPMGSRNRGIKAWLLLVFTVLGHAFLVYLSLGRECAAAQDHRRADTHRMMARFPIVTAKRTQPLDSYARGLLYRLSGKTFYQDQTATEWGTRLLFAPRSTMSDEVFLVENAALKSTLGLDGRRMRFSYRDLRSSAAVIDSLVADPVAASLFDGELVSLRGKMKAMLGAMLVSRGSQWGVDAFPSTHRGSQIPGGLDAAQDKRRTLVSLMRRSYASGNMPEFGRYAKQYSEITTVVMGIPSWRFGVETAANRLKPIFWIKVWYAFSLALMIFFDSARKAAWFRLSLIVFGIGIVFHAFVIGMRSFVLVQPPGATQYELFLLVSFIAGTAGLLGYRFSALRLSPIAAAVCALIFLIGGSFFGIEGVWERAGASLLSSRMLLPAHVGSMAFGFAGIGFAGIIAHWITLVPVSAFRRAKSRQLIVTFQWIGLGGIVLGTLLGSLWAKRAWGRYWSWDPKEVAAAVLLSWSAGLVVVDRVKRLNMKCLTTGAIAGNILAASTWIGTNLLGIGRHSYGFSGAALGLFTVFVLVELVFAGIALSKRPVINLTREGVV